MRYAKLKAEADIKRFLVGKFFGISGILIDKICEQNYWKNT